MYSIEFEIPTRDTDANKRRGRHWTTLKKTNDSIKSEVYLLTRDKVPVRPLERFLISITRHGARALDYDNLIGSFKPYIDSIVKAKIIRDDSWKYIRHIDADQVISEERKLVIKIEELC